MAVQGPLSSTSGDVLRQWALAGEGLSLEAAWDVSDDLCDGRLVACLPQITWQEVTLYATFLLGWPVPARQADRGLARPPRQQSRAARSGGIGVGLAAVLLLLKLAATTASLRAGAEGGMLTPGMVVGALLATILAAAWTAWWPGTPPGAFAVVGGAAFLASSMTMPLTATVLILEFTRMDHDVLVPVMLAVGGATAARQWMGR